MRNWLLIVAVLAATALAAGVTRRTDPLPSSNRTAATGSAPLRPPVPSTPSHTARAGRDDFVGSAACAACHRTQSEAYLDSHHAKALVAPTSDMPPARFDNAAVELAPADPHFSYVLAVALASQGDRDEAIRVLGATLTHRPNDASTLRALASYLRESGQIERASETARELEALLRE